MTLFPEYTITPLRWGRFPHLVVVVASALVLTGCGTAEEGHHHYHPEVSVPDGQQHGFAVWAEGVQIYVWSGTNWAFSTPDARLVDTSKQPVGKHYTVPEGPIWEGLDGSRVVGSRVATADAYNSNSIPHLLLKAVSSSDRGTFSHITYIQRADTMGGIAPTVPGQSIGEEARVKYTAEYVFYRRGKTH